RREMVPVGLAVDALPILRRHADIVAGVRPGDTVGRDRIERRVARYEDDLREERLAVGPVPAAVLAGGEFLQRVLVGDAEPAEFRAAIVEIAGVVVFVEAPEAAFRPWLLDPRHDVDGA